MLTKGQRVSDKDLSSRSGCSDFPRLALARNGTAIGMVGLDRPKKGSMGLDHYLDLGRLMVKSRTEDWV